MSPAIPSWEQFFLSSKPCLYKIAFDFCINFDDVLSEAGEVFMTEQRGFDPRRGRFEPRVLHVVRQNLTPGRSRLKRRVELVYEGDFDDEAMDRLCDYSQFESQAHHMSPLELLTFELAASRTDEPENLSFPGVAGAVYKLARRGLTENEIAEQLGLGKYALRTILDELCAAIKRGAGRQADFFGGEEE